MSKNKIDYSNTIIYKITCRDTNIADVYVGHTTNFVQRKHAHKQSCINDKSSNYKCKLYNVIRANGGWNNWKMEIVNFFECKDHYEARQREQEYFISLGATLNSIEPLSNKKIVIQNIKLIPIDTEILLCNVDNIHFKTIETLESLSYSNNLNQTAYKYNCKICDYTTSRKSSFTKHETTRIHAHKTFLNGLERESFNKAFLCKHCKKEYKARNSLWYHQKKCIPIVTKLLENVESSSDNKNLTAIVIELMKSNIELQKQILDVCKINNANNSNISS
jgi:hypothetical protein